MIRLMIGPKMMALMLIAVLLFAHRADCEVVMGLKGRGWIRYKISTENTNKDKITLMFRTFEPFGMLMYSCGDSSFLLLEVKRGRLV